MTFDPGTPPTDADDHVLAAWLATVAGERLLEVRQEGLTGRELKDAGDLAAHDLLMKLLAEHRPGDAVLSEEGKDDKERLSAERVWIVDPLDGTREFSEPPRDDWAVHVALWSRGDLTAGAVAQPALGETFSTADPPYVPPSRHERPRIAVSRTRPPAFVEALAAELDAELVPMGSAGVKAISVVRDITRRLRPRRRAVRVGQRGAGRGRAGGRAVLLPRRRLAPALQPGRRVAPRPDRVPRRAGRPDRRVRARARHRLRASRPSSDRVTAA